MSRNKNIYVFFLSTLLLVGCATNSSQLLTTNQKIGRCAAMVIGGALLGNIIGGDSESAALGAGVGGASCAVWLAFNNEKDKARIAALQAEAARTGELQSGAWEGEDELGRKITVTASTHTNVSDRATISSQPCRTLNTKAEVEGRSEESTELWCRNSNGSWSPQQAGPSTAV